MASLVPSEGSCTSWHLCWQAAIGRELFLDPALYSRVQERLLDAHVGRGRTLIDYVLLPREIHVLSRLRHDDSPGHLARAIGNIVARWVQQTVAVSSPVFAGPFRALRIEDDEELRRESRMLAWRPVQLKLCRTPVHYRHSALRATLGMRPGRGFDSRPMLNLFGDSVRESRAALRKWLGRRPSERETRQWELLCGLALATGTPGSGFVSRKVREAETARLVAAGGQEGIGGALKLLETWVAARLAGGRPLDMHQGRDPTSARGRALVACLAVDHGLCSAASVARHFGKAKATLSEQMAARRARPADRAILAKPLGEIVEEALRLAAATAAGAAHGRQRAMKIRDLRRTKFRVPSWQQSPRDAELFVGCESARWARTRSTRGRAAFTAKACAPIFRALRQTFLSWPCSDLLLRRAVAERSRAAEGSTSLASQRVRALLQRHGVPAMRHVTVIAELLGFGYTQVHRRMKGTVAWEIEEIQQVAAHYGETLADVFGDLHWQDRVDAVLSLDGAHVSCQLQLGDAMDDPDPNSLVAIKVGLTWTVVAAARRGCPSVPAH